MFVLTSGLIDRLIVFNATFSNISEKNTGPKDDSQNRLRLLIPERGEILLCNGEYTPTV
jgi:hypothetical protein